MELSFLDIKNGSQLYQPEPTGLKFIDHMVGNVGWNEMNTMGKVL
jgi:hypothetical protein